MRRRILVSTLIVVAITVTVLGGPLAFTTWRLVEDFTRADMTSRLRQVVATLDSQISGDGQVALERVQIAVPPGGSLVVRTPRGVSTLGVVDPGTTISTRRDGCSFPDRQRIAPMESISCSRLARAKRSASPLKTRTM